MSSQAEDVYQLNGLTPKEAKALELIVSGNIELYNQMVFSEYEQYPVSPEEFFTDPYYLGVSGSDLYPKLLDDLIECCSGNYTEVIMGGAIGYGKSTFTEFALLYTLYKTLCLRNPQASFDLMEDTSILIVNISTTERQAKKAIFTGIKNKVKQSKFFNDVFPPNPNVTSELQFPKKISITPGASTSNAIIGLNVISAAIDESNFMAVQQKSNSVDGRLYSRGGGVYDKAEALYTQLARRIKSRFLNSSGQLPGAIFTISSASYPDDFLERRMKQAIRDKNIFVRSYALWDVKPEAYAGSDKFFVEVGKGYQSSRILSGNEDKSTITGDIIEVPSVFRGDFEKDLEGCIRDLAGVSTLTVDQYMKNFARITSCIDPDRKHPYTSLETNLMDGSGLNRKEYLIANNDGTTQLKYNPDAPRVAHIDSSLSGDSTGIAVGHIVDLIKCERRDPEGNAIVEYAPLIFYDLLLRVNPPKGGEIILERVRDIILYLLNDGVPIKIVTMDQFQSAESMQQFKKRGLLCDLLSVDRTIEPYETLKQAFYEERVNMYDYPAALKELRTLELDKAKGKVDHPPNGSKDVTDAMAAVAYTLTIYANKIYTPAVSSRVFG